MYARIEIGTGAKKCLTICNCKSENGEAGKASVCEFEKRREKKKGKLKENTRVSQLYEGGTAPGSKGISTALASCGLGSLVDAAPATSILTVR